MSRVVLQLVSDAMGQPMPHTGQYLRDFDFEAHDGQGEITMTPSIDEAMVFDDMHAAVRYVTRSPVCRPTRPDGHPNRPLRATTWNFHSLDAGL